MDDITEMTMEEYKKWLRNENRSGFVPPEIPSTTNFELKGNFITMLKDNPFYRKDQEDAYKNIDKVLDIVNYLNVPNVSCESVLLRMLPITFKEQQKTNLIYFHLEPFRNGQTFKKNSFNSSVHLQRFQG